MIDGRPFLSDFMVLQAQTEAQVFLFRADDDTRTHLAITRGYLELAFFYNIPFDTKKVEWHFARALANLSKWKFRRPLLVKLRAIAAKIFIANQPQNP